MTTTPAPFNIRQAALPVYLPTLLFAAGESAFIPVIPVIAKNLGSDLAAAGIIAGMLTVGILVGDLPSGLVIARIGERAAMLWSTLIALLGGALALLSTTPWMLGAGIFLIGVATASFALARHAFLTSFVPLSHRARALSMLGGMFRGGSVIGPLAASAALTISGNPFAAFWLMVAFTLATGAVLLFLPDPEKTFGTVRRVKDATGHSVTPGELEVENETHGLFKTIRNNMGALARLGVAAAIIQILRSGRSVLLPLWAVSIGMRDADTALIIGIAAIVDFALFFTSGQVMDRYGRLAASVPTMLVMSLSLMVLAFTHGFTAVDVWFIALTMTLAVGNGLSSGIVLTLGADLADKKNPAQFLGAWRFTTDSGAAAGPLIIGAVIAISSISVAAFATGIIGLIGMGMMIRYVPRYTPARQPKGSPKN
jgi:MFS family permease